MLAIILLVIGIIGFVKGRISLTKHKELRGPALYVVASLFCLPLPLSFIAGVILGASSAASGQQLNDGTVRLVGALCVWVPVLAGFVIAFAKSQPKLVDPNNPNAPRGFEVTPPPPGPPQMPPRA